MDGRADQTTKVKGMFVHPSQIAEIVKRHPEIGRARLVVSGEAGQDEMTLMCETSVTDDELATKISESVTTVTKLRGTVSLVAPEALPNDGKVISDERSYD